MPVMLERWNDDKMDGLSEKVDGLGVRATVLEEKVDGLGVRATVLEEKVDGLGVRATVLEEKVDGLAVELREQRREMKSGFERVDERFEKADERFERLNQVLIGAAATIIVALISAPHL